MCYLYLFFYNICIIVIAVTCRFVSVADLWEPTDDGKASQVCMMPCFFVLNGLTLGWVTVCGHVYCLCM